MLAIDLSAEARLLGLITFHFACYGAGVPKLDEFAKETGLDERQEIAEEAFIASLPKKLLSHPQGGALAVIGHMERAWGYSFSSTGVKSNTGVFESMLTALMSGLPVGAAAEFLDERYAELATELTKMQEEMDFGKRIDPGEVSSLWTAHNDARDYIIIGDPAVRLPVETDGQKRAQTDKAVDRPVVEPESKAYQPLNLPTTTDLVTFIQNEPPDNDYLPELEEIARLQTGDFHHLGTTEAFDSQNLAEAGWGIVFTTNASPAIKEALQPLLDLRQQQAGERFAILEYQAGQSKNKKNEFLVHNGGRPGPVDPDQVPYYLLLVGSPAEIPYDFQQQLGGRYAVGRIHFDTIAEYDQYARSLVAAETNQVKLSRQTSFFSVTYPDDQATEQRTKALIDPLIEAIRQKSDWQVAPFLRAEATKTQLEHLLGGEQTPALLVASSYGATFPKIDPLQIYQQGALLCADWPGPANPDPITQKYYFAADDLPGDGNVLGLLTFLITDYGAGTPQDDNFTSQMFKTNGRTFPKYPFVAGLPKALLSHRQGGALGVISYVGPVWDHTFSWSGAAVQRDIFTQTISQLLDRYPVGAAVQAFSERYAKLTTDLANTLEEMDFGKRVPPDEVAGLWAASHDVGQCVIIGDPAARLPIAEAGETPLARPVVEMVSRGETAGLISKPTTIKAPPGISDTDWQNTPASVQEILTQYIKRYGRL